MRRQLTTEQRDRIIAKVARLHRLARWHPSYGRFKRVANRLQYWLADVRYNAQWAALYDCIEHNYARNRISYDDAIDELRWLGIDAKSGVWQFPLAAELAHRHYAATSLPHFNGVQWELSFYRNQARMD